MVPAALIGVLLLSGCAEQGASSATPTPTSATSTATPTTPPNVTASPRPTASPTTDPTAPATVAPPATTEPTEPTTPAVPSAEAAYDTVVDACTSWQDSLSQDAATFPGTQAQAAGLAATAAAADPKWQAIASDMAGLVAIGTDTSSESLAKGQELFTDLSTQCGSVGVTVNAG